jgi:hypothetical protein
MRVALVLVATLGACSSPTATKPPPQNVTPTSPIPPDLGSLVIVTTPSRTDATPGFVPITTKFPLVDPARRMPPNTPMQVIDRRGTRGTFTSVEPTTIEYGCDGNQLAVTPLAGTAKLEVGIAWALHDVAVRPSARAPIVVAQDAKATYGFGELAVTVERDPQKQDRGLMRFLVDNEEVGASGFVRTLMDGADPKLATIDIREGGPSVPVALAAWSIDGSGHAPFLVAVERPGWEGTSLEAWLVEARSAKQIEAMTAYLYQCAF